MAYFHTTVLDNQIKALPTVSTASGSVATFDTDLTENLVEVKCQIVAKQASGTPSPDNPLPITTYTEMNVGATGKNLLKIADFAETELNGVKFSCVNGVVTADGQATANTIFNILPLGTGVTTIDNIIANPLPDTNYILSGSFGGAYNSTYWLQLLINGSGAEPYSSYTDSLTFSFTSAQLASQQRRVAIRIKNGTVMDNVKFYPMIRFASDTNEFEPFNGTTKNIPFGQTVANGVLDITTGKLRVTDGYATFDGSESWSAYSTFNYHYQITLSNVLINEDQNKNSYSSHFTSRAGMSNNAVSITEGVFSADANRIRFKNVDCADLTEWISFVTTQYNNGTPVQVVYKLATPIEIQLDSITLQALLNENNIWCDTGDTEVKYLLSVGKKIS